MVDTTAPRGSCVEIAKHIRLARRILAVTHVSPDGDAIGSLVSFGHIASELGIDIRLYCESPVPDYIGWLTPPVPVLSDLSELSAKGTDEWIPDTVAFLDCAESERAGDTVRDYIARLHKSETPTPCTTICIDHHVSNPSYADVNWVDPGACATGVMVATLAKTFGIPLSGALGEAIYLALVSDTGSFSYSNTNAQGLEVAAEIVHEGLPLAEFTAKYENNWSLPRMHLWGQLMGEVQVVSGGKVVVSVVTQDHLDRFGVEKSDLEGYASWLRRLAGVKVVLFCRPSSKGAKISLRSMGDVDVQKVASRFGGGGHKGAAGIDMPESPQTAATLVLEEICRSVGEPFQATPPYPYER